MAKTKNTYNLANATMSAAPSSGTTVYTMDDMNKNIKKEQNKVNLANFLGVGLGSYDFSPKVSEPYWLYSSDGTKTYNGPDKNKSTFNNTYDVSDYVNSLIGSGGSGGYGGYYTLDISGMLNAYEQQAAADRAVAQQAYNTKREDLLTSLKRFQEQNAKDVQNQQRAYLSNQASLESAIAQADRQNRISAAARGLGGSGLQQLAQLQNLLSQGQTISDMATQNQGVMDNLRTLLANYEADTKTAEERALADYTNTLNSINAQLATNKANAEVARANSYIPYSPGSGGITAAEAADYGADIANSLSDIVASYKNSKNAYKGTDKYVTYADALSAIRKLKLPQNSAAYTQAVNNLKSIYKSKHNGKAAPNL